MAVGVTLLGLVARLYNLDARSLWVDEVSQAHVTRFSTLGEVMAYTHSIPDVMPLMNIITWLLHGLGSSDWIIRLPSVVAGTLNVFAVYRLGETLLSSRIGLAAAFLMAVLPYHVWYGQEGRPYAILLLLTTLQMLFAYQATVRLRPWAWLWFAICTTANIYTHHLALASTAIALAFIGLTLFLGLVANMGPVRRRLESRGSMVPTPRHIARQVALALASVAAIALAYIPWLPYLSAFLGRPDMGFSRFSASHTATLEEAQTLLATLDFSGPSLLILVAGIATTVLGLFRGHRGQWQAAMLLLLWLFLPLIAFYVRLQGAIVLVWPRYFSFMLPAAVLVSAWGIDGVAAAASSFLKRLRGRGFSGSVFVGFKKSSFVYAAVMLLLMAQVLPALAQSYARPKEDTRGLTSYLAATSPPDSVVIAMGQYAPSLVWGFRYYFWRLGSPIMYYDGARLDDVILARIEQSAGDVWGAVYNDDPIGQNVKGGHEGIEIVSFADITLFRLRSRGDTAADQLRALLRLGSQWQPDLLSGLDLAEAQRGDAPPGENLLPSPVEASQAGGSGESRWLLSAGSVEVVEDSFLLSPNGSQAQATWSTTRAKPRERYGISFEYRNPGLTGYQRVYVTARSSDGPDLTTFPVRPGYLCSPSVEWKRGIFTFTTPPGTGALLVKLSVTGTGTAGFRNVHLWKVK